MGRLFGRYLFLITEWLFFRGVFLNCYIRMILIFHVSGTVDDDRCLLNDIRLDIVGVMIGSLHLEVLSHMWLTL